MDQRLKKLAEVLVHYSTAVKPGEKVLLRTTSPAGEPLVQALYQEALKAGAYAYTYIHLRDEESLALDATTSPDLLSQPNPMLKMVYESFDVLITVAAVENVRALTDYPVEQQRSRAKAGATLTGVVMDRAATGQLRWCLTQIPTQAYAQAAGMSLSQYSDFVFNAGKLNLPDPVAAWRQVEQEQQRLVDFLKGKKRLHVRGQHIDLEMSIEGRTFNNACGKTNFPDGEIFTGPVEDSVNGWVKFTYPAFYRSNEVNGIELTFENGLVTKATAERNEAFLLATLDTDAGSRRLGEFAIGTNHDIQRFTGTILFDEKIGGTVHMAVGKGYPETGSRNTSDVHWDMICDMREGGEIFVDGQLFYQHGKFVI